MADLVRAREALNHVLLLSTVNTEARYYVKLALSHLQDTRPNHCPVCGAFPFDPVATANRQIIEQMKRDDAQ